jgi:anaerobic magnesium-protoporphyrin IX monomethyl ester cyclase
MAFFLAIAPWPYAEIYPMLKDQIEVFDYSRYNLVEPVMKTKTMSLQEVQDWLGKASREFYTHKMNTLDSMTPKKREFMIKVIHIIATSSYLAKTMKGTMPEDIKKMLEKMHVHA